MMYITTYTIRYMQQTTTKNVGKLKPGQIYNTNRISIIFVLINFQFKMSY
jgi:hypothetical protein